MNPSNSINAINTVNVGLISDTHGLLRPEVETVLAGCDHILHAGDVGDGRILEKLQTIAPTVAVRGNMDYGSWSNHLPETEMVEIGGVFFYLLHDRYHLDLDPKAAGIRVVVTGHTHQPEIIDQDGVLFINPGSAGHRRHNYPVSVGFVRVENGQLAPRIVSLDC